MDLLNYLSLHGSAGKTVLGFSKNPKTTREVAIGRGDLLFIDHVLSNNPQWIDAIELGTWVGITSLYIGLAMKMRGGTFHTFDISDNREEASKKGWLDNMTFHAEDILSGPNQNVVELFSRDNVFAFVDNGNKAREVNMYCQFLKSGSGFITHDWDIEIRIGDIQATLNQFEFNAEYEDIAISLNSNCRFWRRK